MKLEKKLEVMLEQERITQEILFHQISGKE